MLLTHFNKYITGNKREMDNLMSFSVFEAIDP